MEKKVTELLMVSPERIKSAFEIAANLENLKETIIEKKLVPQVEEIAKKSDLQIHVNEIKSFKKNCLFRMSKDTWKRYEIGIGFDAAGYGGWHYGLVVKNLANPIPDGPKNKFINEGWKSNSIWYIWKDLNTKNWGKDEFLSIVSPEQEMKEIFENKIKELLGIAENIEM